jgi:hypothetical protein
MRTRGMRTRGMRPSAWLAGALLLLLACASGEGRLAGRGAWVAEGEPVNCIRTSDIRTLQALDDRTVEFERNRNQGWRNEPALRCQGLEFGHRVPLNSHGALLCSSDTITPRPMTGGTFEQRCPLGRFQPIRRGAVPDAAEGRG